MLRLISSALNQIIELRFGNDLVDYHTFNLLILQVSKLMPKAVSFIDRIVSDTDTPSFVSSLNSQDINIKRLFYFIPQELILVMLCGAPSYHHPDWVAASVRVSHWGSIT